MSRIRDNWRIVLLVVLVVGSAVALFVPGATTGGAVDSGGLTNLQYGIRLDGGSRIRAPIVGNTTENVDVTPENAERIESTLVDRFGLDAIDVIARPELNTVEVVTRNVTRTELLNALQDMGFDVTREDVREGVTEPTRVEMVNVIEKKLRISALTGAHVTKARTPTGEHYIIIESTDRDIEELRDILNERGVVRIYGAYEAKNGTFVRQLLLTQEDIEDIGDVRRRQRGGFGVSVTVSEQAVDEFLRGISETGLDEPNNARGGVTCNYNAAAPNTSTGRCLIATLNGEVVYAKGISPGLVQSFRDGSFANDPTFVIITTTREAAQNVELSLKAGKPLPAPLDFEHAQTTTLEPALASKFRFHAVITGLLAVLAVSGVVYLRYGNLRIAAPMVVTSLAEVVILLGFIAAIQFPLTLSHIAGLIAVIGTGVDDLIIIADEILQNKAVETGRVFQKRFRKAFWVIGASAATVIIAMSPLTVLSLGDLRGFAIITIIGVLIGVLITRPAYGNVLRHLIIDKSR